MKGVLRSALLFCMAWKLQRLFLAASLILAVVRRLLAGLMQPSSVVTTASMLVGLFSEIGVFGALIIGAGIFRATSAPRTLRLLPYARWQLLLGALLAQVLLAAFVTGNIDFIQDAATQVSYEWSMSGNTFVRTLTGMSLSVVWIFFVFSDSPWQRWVATAVPSVAVAMFILSPQSRLTLAHWGTSRFALVTLTAWSLFGAWYSRARRIAPPPGVIDNLGSAHAPDTKDIQPRGAALNIYLLGRPSVVRACWPDVALTLALSVTFTVISMLPTLDLSPVLILTILIAGGTCFQRVRPIAQRARALWIRGGFTRGELFKAAERLSLRCMAWVGMAVLALSALDWMILPHPSADWKYLLILGFATLLCNVYFGLAGTRWPSLSPLMVIASGALDVLVLLPDSLWLSWGVSWSHALILTTEIVLVPSLRYIARWRWRRIDWLICKPVPVSLQAMRPVT